MNQSVIATTPGAMVAAQAKLVGWIDVKLASCAEERSHAEALLVQLRLAHAASTHADKMLDSCRRRERFYEKVRTAITAGYYIIPPFDCQVFAIRTDRELPPRQFDQSSTKWRPPSVPTLPPGEGRYVAALPTRSLEHVDERPHPTNGTKLVEKYFSNDDWREVEFPVKAMKPELVETTAAAMQAKIFDAFAIGPEYRAADPIIVGQIKHWKSGRTPLTFFVAWWLDQEDL